jgi:hypothetical protein
MEDSPAIILNKPASLFEIDLTFRGDLLDVSQNKVLASRSWSVKGEFQTPNSFIQDMSTELNQFDQIIFVKEIALANNDQHQLHVFVKRQANEAALSLDGLDLQLTAVDGSTFHPTGEPNIFETGRNRSKLTSLVYTLPSGVAKPRELSLRTNRAKTIFISN